MCETARQCRYLVVGGGIAGVSCSSTLQAYDPGCGVILLSSSPLIKSVRNIQQVTRALSTFDVAVDSHERFQKENPGVETIHGTIAEMDHDQKVATLDTGAVIKYEMMCVCTGAIPRTPFPPHPRVITIRDTGSVKELEEHVKSARRMVIVGNGGIATELAYQIRNCAIVWCVRDRHIANIYFDSGAAHFLLPMLGDKTKVDAEDDSIVMKRMPYRLDAGDACDSDRVGSALGPDWHRSFDLQSAASSCNKVDIKYGCQVGAVEDCDAGDEFPIRVEVIGSDGVRSWEPCDFLVSATGVRANCDEVLLPTDQCRFDTSEGGGVIIDTNMRVEGLEGVYAAGDVCSCVEWPPSQHWFHMRLWTQARQMGQYAARCMTHHRSGDTNIPTDICFDMFAHSTSFFGKKLVLLGRYNMQGVSSEEKGECELLLRTTARHEYVKVVLLRGRMLGAVLIGDTDFEETFENLILNQTDVAYLGSDLLNPDIDIADYFD